MERLVRQSQRSEKGCPLLQGRRDLFRNEGGPPDAGSLALVVEKLTTCGNVPDRDRFKVTVL